MTRHVCNVLSYCRRGNNYIFSHWQFPFCAANRPYHITGVSSGDGLLQTECLGAQPYQQKTRWKLRTESTYIIPTYNVYCSGFSRHQQNKWFLPHVCGYAWINVTALTTMVVCKWHFLVNTIFYLLLPVKYCRLSLRLELGSCNSHRTV